MALPENARRMLQPLGLLVGFVGVIVALWAFTGERALEFSYFWVGLTGLLLVIGGVVLAAFGRATAPRGRAAKRKVQPKADAKVAGKAPTRPANDAPLPKADRVKLKHLGATLGLKRKKPEPAPEPAEPAAGAPPAPEVPLTIECPTCSARFEVAAGAREAKCPRCGALGDVPSEGAHA